MQEDPYVVLVADYLAHEDLGHQPDPGNSAGRERRDAPRLLKEGIHDPVMDFPEQGLLAVNVIVECPTGEFSRGSNIADPCRRVSIHREQMRSQIDNLVSTGSELRAARAPPSRAGRGLHLGHAASFRCQNTDQGAGQPANRPPCHVSICPFEAWVAYRIAVPRPWPAYRTPGARPEAAEGHAQAAGAGRP